MIESLQFFADAQTASATLRTSISPLFSAMVTVAAILCVLIIVFGGYNYITSAGNPEKLENAKRTLRNAFIGFVVVLAAGSLVAIMQNAYSSKAVQPVAVSVEQPKASTPTGLGTIINEAITSFVQTIVQSIGQPVVDMLKQFTSATPLVAQNGSVFNVWIVMVAIADVLLLLIVGLIGFRIMGASVIGLGEVDLKSLIPQVVLAFIVANLSIFAIDAIISVSNAMIQALLIGMSNDIIWVTLGTLITTIASVNIGIMLLIAIAIILAVMLLIYYLQRMIVLYVGAVLSPLVVLLWLLPSFRDFAVTAVRMYIVTIFVLFVHVSILMLAVALFSSMIQGKDDSFMAALLGIATLLVLLKTSRTVNQMAILGSSNHSMRRLSSTFVSGVSFMAGAMRQMPATATAGSGVQSGSSTSTSSYANTSATRSIMPITSAPLKTGETQRAQPQPKSQAASGAVSFPAESLMSGGTAYGEVVAAKRTRRTSKGGKK